MTLIKMCGFKTNLKIIHSSLKNEILDLFQVIYKAESNYAIIPVAPSSGIQFENYFRYMCVQQQVDILVH